MIYFFDMESGLYPTANTACHVWVEGNTSPPSLKSLESHFYFQPVLLSSRRFVSKLNQVLLQFSHFPHVAHPPRHPIHVVQLLSV